MEMDAPSPAQGAGYSVTKGKSQTDLTVVSRLSIGIINRVTISVTILITTPAAATSQTWHHRSDNDNNKTTATRKALPIKRETPDANEVVS
jgi:hypothetical protein